MASAPIFDQIRDELISFKARLRSKFSRVEDLIEDYRWDPDDPEETLDAILQICCERKINEDFDELDLKLRRHFKDGS